MPSKVYYNGEPFLELQPRRFFADLSEIIVEGEINEMDAVRVREGLKAIVMSDAYPGKQFQTEAYKVSPESKPRNTDPENPAVIGSKDSSREGEIPRAGAVNARHARRFKNFIMISFRD